MGCSRSVPVVLIAQDGRDLGGVGVQSLGAAAGELLAQAERGEINDAHARLLALAERELLTQAIKRAGNNQAKAARWLGLSRLTVRLKLTQLGLRPPGGSSE